MEEKIMIPRDKYIWELACKTNEINLSCHNSKTGPMCNTLAFPTSTCREDAPCKATGCYCMKGTQNMATVVGAYIRNLRLYNENPEDFWAQVKFKLEHRPFPLFRWYDSGDIPDAAFFEGMVNLALEFPKIKFMAFTKKYYIVNDWLDKHGKLPDNFNVMFSAWHLGWKVENPHNLPVAYVDFTDKTLNPEFPKGITGCPNQKDKLITCSICQKCWKKNVKAVKFIQH